MRPLVLESVEETALAAHASRGTTLVRRIELDRPKTLEYVSLMRTGANLGTVYVRQGSTTIPRTGGIPVLTEQTTFDVGAPLDVGGVEIHVENTASIDYINVILALS
jgi:hypothetical protein